jgi:DNA oxidative demethylase
MRKAAEIMDDLLSGVRSSGTQSEALAPGAMLLRGFADIEAGSIAECLREIIASAPLRHMVTRGGRRMSVAMTNCGRVGWITDQRGYRYDAIDPMTEKRWPPIPPLFLRLAQRAAAAAGFDSFQPDSCLINRYEPGARLSLHQDRNESSFDAPIVSVSLGLPAIFLFGGLLRSDRPRRIRLESGDVVVWGGPARLAFHGVESLADGIHPLTGRCRMNLTFRKAL